MQPSGQFLTTSSLTFWSKLPVSLFILFFASHPCSSYCPPTWGFSGPTVVLLNCKTVIPRQYRLEPAYLGGKAAPPLSSCVTSSKLLHFSILNFFSQCCVRAGE